MDFAVLMQLRSRIVISVLGTQQSSGLQSNLQFQGVLDGRYVETKKIISGYIHVNVKKVNVKL